MRWREDFPSSVRYDCILRRKCDLLRLTVSLPNAPSMLLPTVLFQCLRILFRCSLFATQNIPSTVIHFHYPHIASIYRIKYHRHKRAFIRLDQEKRVFNVIVISRLFEMFGVFRLRRHAVASTFVDGEWWYRINRKWWQWQNRPFFQCFFRLRKKKHKTKKK